MRRKLPLDLVSPVQPGEVLAERYRVDRIIGGGAMGVVALARHLELDQRVAIKLVRRDVLDNAQAVQRLLVEAKATAKLKSEYIPRILDVGKLDDGTPFIAMEYLRGQSLGARLDERGRIPLPQALNYVLQACIGISEAHAHGIVHRDIKPDNLFVTTSPDGHDLIKVLDFGISKILQQYGPDGPNSGHTLTATKMTIGSPLYASPEQFGNARHVDARADVWGLGVTLFELISDSVPFEGESLHQIVQSVFRSPPRVLSAVVEGIPAALDSVIARCLRLEREHRYPSVPEFAAALARFGPPGSDALARRAALVAQTTTDALSDSDESQFRAPALSNSIRPPPASNSVRPPPASNSVRPPPASNSIRPPPLSNSVRPPPLSNSVRPPPPDAEGALAGEMTERWIQGRFRVLLQLGEGSTSRVELGWLEGHGQVGKLVVLKTLKGELADNVKYRRMFLTEARLCARLTHPNIVQVNDVLTEDHVPTIVMEYLEGKTLGELVRRARNELPLNVGLKIVSDMLSGLHAAHEFHDYDGKAFPIVHRDVSARNVFVTYTGDVKVLDFGLAKVIGGRSSTRAGEMKGNLRHISPEQLRGDPDIDRRTDIYAAGVMLWEIATGTALWSGVTDLEVFERAQSGKILRPRQINPRVPKALDRVCMKALATDRRDRYETAAALQADLETVIAELGPVSNKDLAALMLDYFGRDRSEQQRFVDAQLREYTPTITPGTHTLSTRDNPARRRGLIRAVLLAAGILSLVGGMLFASSWLSRKHRAPESAIARVSSAAQTVASVSASAPTRVDPPRTIAVTVSATPLSAKLVLDGKELPNNPYFGRAEVDGSPHTLSASADGYVGQERVVRFGSDLELVLTLEAQERPTGKAHATAMHRAASRPKPPKPGETVDCSTPYTLDGDGIKHFKPGCL